MLKLHAAEGGTPYDQGLRHQAATRQPCPPLTRWDGPVWLVNGINLPVIVVIDGLKMHREGHSVEHSGTCRRLSCMGQVQDVPPSMPRARSGTGAHREHLIAYNHTRRPLLKVVCKCLQLSIPIRAELLRKKRPSLALAIAPSPPGAPGVPRKQTVAFLQL